MNLVILIGNIGKDPELKYLSNGDAVCNFSIATTEIFFDKNKEKQERTEWHRITAWRKQAEAIAQYAGKGSKISVSGRLQTREFEKDGSTRYATEINVNNFEFINSKAPAGGGSAKGPALPKGAETGNPEKSIAF
jgi:single-strand DNA-binding protein